MSGNAKSGFTVTNTHTPVTLKVPAQKKWDDANNKAGKRPDSVTLNLLADGQKRESVTVTEDDGWKHEFTGLAKYLNGKAIAYTVTEEAVSGYIASVSGSVADGFTITNTLEDMERTVKVEKVWEDNDNENDNRPEHITVNLLADGVQKDSKEITEEENWTWEFTGLELLREDGQPIVYTVTEDPLTRYDTTITGSAADGFVITNTEKCLDIKVQKVWNDNDDALRLRPDSVTYLLTANGQKTYKQTGSRETDWGTTFKNLPVYENEEKIRYELSEVTYSSARQRYRAKVEGTAEEGFTVTNTLVETKMDIQVNKIWVPIKDDEVIPSSLEITLIRKRSDAGDAAPYYDVEKVQMTPDAEGVWSYTFKNQDIYDRDGTAWVYSVREEIPAGYNDPIIMQTLYNRFTIYNTKKYTMLIVEKVWDDQDDAAGKRPEKIEIELLADGNPTGITLELPTQDGEWRDAFRDLPVTDDDGNMIQYTAREEDVGAYGYTTEYGEPQEGDYDSWSQQITNRLETVAVSGTKTWDDADNQDGKRPESITIKLLADGKEIDKLEVKPDAKGNWNFRFENLPMYEGSRQRIADRILYRGRRGGRI